MCGGAAPTADMDVVMRGGAGRPIATGTYGFATSVQDLRRTEMRGYGVGGNEKGHAALAKRPNKENAD